jgi:hypothetical protein
LPEISLDITKNKYKAATHARVTVNSKKPQITKSFWEYKLYPKISTKWRKLRGEIFP